jgi:chromosome partitioning protein
MDVLPSNIDMTAAEPELTLSRRGGEQLALALEHVEDAYDYVIIDCPPYLGYLTDNGIYAAGNILIPALAESTSKRALELLFDHIEALELDYEITIGERGVVANRVEETNEAKEMMEWFEDAFPDVPVWEVRKRVALQRAFSEGSSIFEYKPDLDMTRVFMEIAESLDQQFGVDTESEVKA